MIKLKKNSWAQNCRKKVSPAHNVWSRQLVHWNLASKQPTKHNIRSAEHIFNQRQEECQRPAGGWVTLTVAFCRPKVMFGSALIFTCPISKHRMHNSQPQ